MKRDSIVPPVMTLTLVIAAIGIIGYAGDCAGRAYKDKPVESLIEKVVDLTELQKPVDIGYKK